jgi:hypothetical protein
VFDLGRLEALGMGELGDLRIWGYLEPPGPKTVDFSE